jgi:hypothetical protein
MNSESIAKIATALVEAHKAFKPVSQSGTNPHLRSKYSTIADYLNAVQGALLSNGICISQSVSKTEVGIAVTTKLIHVSGEYLESDACVLPVEKPNAQAVGSAISYARRYSLASFLGIAAGTEDDDGAAASKVAPSKPSAAEAARAAKQVKQEGVPF